MEGSLIILCFLVIGVVAAYITAGASSTTDDGTDTTFADQCSTSGNSTTCESSGKDTFFSAIRDVAVGDFGSGTPAIITVLWILAGVFLLSVGVLLVVASFFPTLGF